MVSKAVRVAEGIRAGDPRNAEYRYHASRAYLWMGDALRRLHRPTEAVQVLNRALEIQKAIAAVSPERIWNLRVLTRTYGFLGEALLDAGDHTAAAETLREGLAVADRMLQRAPLSLYHQLDRADILEAQGRYNVSLATRTATRRAELKREARNSFQQSLNIWQDWKRRKLAEPYASRREAAAVRALASVGSVKE
jgi:tetratricopeptide (TPR) repeat protein